MLLVDECGRIVLLSHLQAGTMAPYIKTQFILIPSILASLAKRLHLVTTPKSTAAPRLLYLACESVIGRSHTFRIMHAPWRSV